jgi:pilus assembly protein CpaE
MWDRLQVRKPQDTTTVVNRHNRATEIQPTLVGRITGTRIAASVVPAAFRELQPVIDAGRIHDLDTRSTVKAGIWSLAGELGLVTGATLPAPRGRKSRRGGGDKGQVTLETLGMTPIILITLILVWQAVLAGYTFTLAGNAADEAARAAAVGTAGDADTAAKADLPSAWRGSEHTDRVDYSEGKVSVTVTLKVPVLFPGAIDFPMRIHGHAQTVDERPDR